MWTSGGMVIEQVFKKDALNATSRITDLFRRKGRLVLYTNVPTPYSIVSSVYSSWRLRSQPASMVAFV